MRYKKKITYINMKKEQNTVFKQKIIKIYKILTEMKCLVKLVII